MSFIPSRSRTPARSSGPVLAVGQRVFVHCVGDRSGTVVLADENGHASRASLADGVAVEVIAWRPRGASGTRYRIRTQHDGVDGWVLASNLRTVEVPVSAPTTPPAEAPSAPSTGRRFGERGWSR